LVVIKDGKILWIAKYVKGDSFRHFLGGVFVFWGVAEGGLEVFEKTRDFFGGLRNFLKSRGVKKTNHLPWVDD